MTIQSSTSKIAYAGAGTTGPFTIPWLFYSATDITVYTTVVSTGVITTLVLNVDYTLAGAGTPSGGTCTTTASVASGTTITLSLTPPLTQLSDYVSGETFPSATLEQDLDREVQIAQYLQRQIDLSIKAPNSEVSPTMTLPAVAARASKYLVFDGSGNITTSAGSGTDTALRTDLAAGASALVKSTGIKYDQTPAEAAAGVTPVNYYVDTTDYGDINRYFTGTLAANADVTTAVQSAINTNCGTVKFPPFPVVVTSGYTCAQSVLFLGLGVPSGGTGSENHPYATILKNFAGDLFTFTGSSGATNGSGGGVRNLRLVQNSGSGITAGGAGTAIKLTGASTSSRPSWLTIQGVIIEYAVGKDSWKWGIDVDGTAITGSVIPDLWIDHVSAHTASSSGGSLRLQAAAAKVFNCAFYDTQGNVTVTGISGTPSSGVLLVNTDISGTLALDWVNDFSLIGGVVTTITNTANTGGDCNLFPARLVNAFTSANNNAGKAFGLLRHSTQDFATCHGSFRMTHQPCLENSQYLVGLNAAGSAAPRVIGINANDRVLIAVDGSDIQLGQGVIGLGGGAAPTLGTIGGGGPSTAGQNCWIKFFDSAGNAVWLPGWR